MKLSAFDQGYEAANKFRNNRISAIVNPFEPGFFEYEDFSEGVYKSRDEKRKSAKCWIEPKEIKDKGQLMNTTLKVLVALSPALFGLFLVLAFG